MKNETPSANWMSNLERLDKIPTLTEKAQFQSTPITLGERDKLMRDRLKRLNERYICDELSPKGLQVRGKLEVKVLASISNPVQRKFYALLLNIRRYEYLRSVGRITASQIQTEDDMKMYLWKEIRNFALNECRKRIGSRTLNKPNMKEDIESDLARMFFEKLFSYDPLQTAPTTYFVKYFQQALSENLEASQNLRSYDMTNIKLVKKWIMHFEFRGIKWNENLIAEKIKQGNKTSKISANVVKRTIDIAESVNCASIEDVQISSPTKYSPEASYLEKERAETIYRVLHETLTPEQIDFLMTRLDTQKTRLLTYEELATKYGITARDAKKQWSQIIAKLNCNKDLDQYRTQPIRGGSVHIDFIDSANDKAAAQFMDFVESF